MVALSPSKSEVYYGTPSLLETPPFPAPLAAFCFFTLPETYKRLVTVLYYCHSYPSGNCNMFKFQYFSLRA